MNRIVGLIAALTAGLMIAVSGAAAFEVKKYDDAAFKAAQAAGGQILVHVTAPWCPTCKAQHQALDTLSNKPELAKLTIFDVDFDTQKDAMKGFKANSQSTLIAFKGDKETGRLAGATKAEVIEGLIKSAAN